MLFIIIQWLTLASFADDLIILLLLLGIPSFASASDCLIVRIVRLTQYLWWILNGKHHQLEHDPFATPWCRWCPLSKGSFTEAEAMPSESRRRSAAKKCCAHVTNQPFPNQSKDKLICIEKNNNFYSIYSIQIGCQTQNMSQPTPSPSPPRAILWEKCDTRNRKRKSDSERKCRILFQCDARRRSLRDRFACKCTRRENRWTYWCLGCVVVFVCYLRAMR